MLRWHDRAELVAVEVVRARAREAVALQIAEGSAEVTRPRL